MFEEFSGLPAHPLIVHAPVVLVPLLAIGAVAYAFLGVVRPHTRWVLGALAVVAPISALLATLSGEEFYARLHRLGQIPSDVYPVINNHQDLAHLALYAAGVLGVLTLALVVLVRPGTAAVFATDAPRGTQVLLLALRLLTLAAAVVTVYYVIRTGDSGAVAVWDGS